VYSDRYKLATAHFNVSISCEELTTALRSSARGGASYVTRRGGGGRDHLIAALPFHILGREVSCGRNSIGRTFSRFGARMFAHIFL
jgi:hypothetical protein